MPSNTLGILGSLSLALTGSQYFPLMWQLEPTLGAHCRLTKWPFVNLTTCNSRAHQLSIREVRDYQNMFTVKKKKTKKQIVTSLLY